MKIAINDRSKSVLKFLIVLFTIGIITGGIIYFLQDKSSKLVINNELLNLTSSFNTIKQNNIFLHIIIFSILLMLSFFVIGLPIILFYFYYEGVSLGFLIFSFLRFAGIKGVVFSLIFILFSKLIYLFLVFYFSYISIIYTKKILPNIKEKNHLLLSNHLIRSIIIIVFVFINDIFLYFLGNKIISLFLFLI